ncbi:hypothetical protein JCM21900_003759 [Sporobolomyces salmonicolor]
MGDSPIKEIKGDVPDVAQANPLLLDDEGALSDKLYEILKEVFHRYAKPPTKLVAGMDEKVCGREELNRFAKDTNGQDMTDETYNEIVEFLDVTDEGELTFKGFIQLYTLQTENDPAETENDLKSWNYDPKTLELISTRKTDEKELDAEEGQKPPIERLTGTGMGGELKDEVAKD